MDSFLTPIRTTSRTTTHLEPHILDTSETKRSKLEGFKRYYIFTYIFKVIQN